ncbi:unnamed protein product [Orchesella dallaii]|uniref:Reverse transcriptase domain-containing protein n=1 Tax=Orchesella dallaii TaxID=48710 RepID=A0ABP1QA09_9HEXA
MFISENNVDILCVSETFLSDEKNPDLMLHHNIVRYDRTSSQSSKQHGGGVAILTNKSLTTTKFTLKCIEHIQLTSKVEVVVAKIKWCKAKPILITTVYRPPNYDNDQISSDLYAIKLLCEELINTSLEVIMCGDFNLRLPKHLSKLTNSLAKLNLKQLINQNTRGEAMLDLLITNSKYVTNTSVFEPHISDHKAIQCHYLTDKKLKNTKTITYRSFRSVNFEGVVSDFKNSKYQYDYNKSIDQNTSEFINIITSIYDKHAPRKTKTVVLSNKVKYVSVETRNKINLREKLRNIKDLFPTASNISRYTKLKGQVKADLKYDFKKSVEEKVQKEGLWPVVNSLTADKNTTDIKFSASDINNYFINIGKPTQKISAVKNDYKLPQKSQFKLRKLLSSDIVRAWKKMRNKCSASEDANGIANIMLNQLINIPEFLLALTNLYNIMIVEGKVPQILKIAKIIPLPKKNSIENCGDLRPISILPVLAKIFEKCIYQQLISFISSNNILSEFQFGFRPKCSTKHAELYVKSVIKDNAYNNMGTAIATVDILKAFDTVPRPTLKQALINCGIVDECIHSYIDERQQYVVNKNDKSSTLFTHAGLAQGGCLSGILFAIFINELPKSLEFSKICIYADDTQLLKSITLSEKVEDTLKLEKDCNNLNRWMNENGMKLNLSKTELLYIPLRKQDSAAMNITIDGMQVNSKQQMKSLGLIKDSKLNWKHNTNKTKSKCNKALWKVRSLRSMLDQDQIKSITEALVLPTMYYMIAVWRDCEVQYLKQIKSLYNSAKRLINSDPSECTWLSPSAQYQYEIAMLAFHSIHNTGPYIFNNKINLTNLQRRETRRKCHQRINRSESKDYLEYILTNAWLNLTEELQSTVQITAFKRKLKQYLLSNEFEARSTCDYSCIEDVILLYTDYEDA